MFLTKLTGTKGKKKMDDLDKFEDKDKFDTLGDVTFKETYSPSSNIKIDAQIKERFKQDGYELKWINRHNIRKRMHPNEGYSLVSPEEFSDSELLTVGDTDSYGDAAMVVTGDLVLMKVKSAKNEARREYYANRTKSQADAIEQRLRENAIEHGGTKSVVRTGKSAHFAKGF